MSNTITAPPLSIFLFLEKARTSSVPIPEDVELWRNVSVRTSTMPRPPMAILELLKAAEAHGMELSPSVDVWRHRETEVQKEHGNT